MLTSYFTSLASRNGISSTLTTGWARTVRDLSSCTAAMRETSNGSLLTPALSGRSRPDLGPWLFSPSTGITGNQFRSEAERWRVRMQLL
ncbi:hypothetical protein HS088_TW13G00970 [Tripterygium wilfordii]|uniref:Uncharacterized protein n=1 Tax=Tripterygium wilfordii TaxID=458696 RepID=A0A7J7CVB5_TRIWF|nr:hypothetical protein HS088_TW13G00970 [Tripterygium wilfordii]